MKITSTLLIFCVLCLSAADSSNAGTIAANTTGLPLQLLVAPSALYVSLGGQETLSVFSRNEAGNGAILMLRVVSEDETIASVETASIILEDADVLPGLNATSFANFSSSGNVTLRGEFMGYTKLHFDIHVCEPSVSSCNASLVADDSWTRLPFQYDVIVVRKHRLVDDVFRGTIAILIVVINVAMGCKVELEIVKEVLKKPVAPAIGLFCQFTFMPLLSFGVARLANLSPGETIGVFTIGCAPGGGASNIYTYLILGDVSLSITMTLVSTFASLAMVPLWMFTLGRYILQSIGRAEVTIPYVNIISSLAGILIPVAIGIVIQKKAPKVAEIIKLIIRPFLFVFLLFMFTFGVWVNYPLFQLFNTRLVFAGMVLPLFGYTCGGLVAAACRLPWKRVKTIALETGIQNTGVAIVLLLFSLTAPENDFSIIGCVAVSMFTPIGPLLAAIFYEVRRRCRKRKEVAAADDQTGDGEKEEEDSTAATEGRDDADDDIEVEDRKYETYRRRSSQIVLKF